MVTINNVNVNICNNRTWIFILAECSCGGVDETGKEEIIIHGQNNEQTQVCTKEGARHEKLGADQPNPESNFTTLRDSIILPKDSSNWFIERMLHLSRFLVHRCLVFRMPGLFVLVRKFHLLLVLCSESVGY